MAEQTTTPRVGDILAERATGNLRLQLLLERPSDAEKVLRIIKILGAATPEEIEAKLRAINLPIPIERVRTRVNSLLRRGHIIRRREDGRYLAPAQEVH